MTSSQVPGFAAYGGVNQKTYVGEFRIQVFCGITTDLLSFYRTELKYFPNGKGLLKQPSNFSMG